MLWTSTLRSLWHFLSSDTYEEDTEEEELSEDEMHNRNHRKLNKDMNKERKRLFKAAQKESRTSKIPKHIKKSKEKKIKAHSKKWFYFIRGFVFSLLYNQKWVVFNGF